MAKIPDSVREKLEAANFWHLGTINENGSPQVTPMWVHVDGDRIMMNTSVGRVKERNLRRDPRLCLSFTDRDNPYERIEIRGRVAEWRDGDEGIAGIDSLAQKYLGEPKYPWLQPGEQRVNILVEPTLVRHEIP